MSDLIKYWSPKKILKCNAIYNIIYGERSNGKTTGCLLRALEEFVKSGYINQAALIRRWQEDYKGAKGTQIVDVINALGYVEQYTKGLYNRIVYNSQRWYLCRFDNEGVKESQCDIPFMYAFSLASEEHYKMTAYPNITTIIFDEFITRSYYLPDEFVKFQNLISTIVRLRDNVIIFMCGNTINKFCPYFNEMGLTNIKKQLQGTIDVYTYGDTGLKVAVEYCGNVAKSKPSDKYFAFNNPKLQMITKGGWEIDIYPHLPCNYIDNDIRIRYFIEFDKELLECKIIYSSINNYYFTYIHRKTTPLKRLPRDIIYTSEASPEPLVYSNLCKPVDEISKLIYTFFIKDKVFYQDNEVGEIVRNYIIACKKSL